MVWNGTVEVEIWSDIPLVGSAKSSSEEICMIVLRCCGVMAKF